MAKATQKVVARPVITEVVEVTLQLSLEEAHALRAVVTNVGGSPYKSRRKHTDEIGVALQQAGMNDASDDVERCLWFKDIS